MSETNQPLVTLRGQIIDKILPLLDSNTLETSERFDLLLRMAEVQGKPELYTKAFTLVDSIDDSDERLRLYMQLLGEVEFELNDVSSTAEQTPSDSGDTPTVEPTDSQQQPEQPSTY